jgi:hypothetical protein
MFHFILKIITLVILIAFAAGWFFRAMGTTDKNKQAISFGTVLLHIWPVVYVLFH